MKRKNVLFIIAILLASFIFPHPASAEVSIPQQDQTPITPLVVPGPAVRPRYISGFGVDNAYTIFYEDRNDTAGCTFGSRIYYHQTSSGPLGLSASTRTDICDTHFIVKNWPITIGATTYAYRGWGAVGNNPDHTFYVSNNLTNWTQVGPFFNFPNPFGDQILYGFHDIVQLNGNYIGFAESAGGHTYIIWSDNGDQTWSVIARVGGSAPTDHLVLPASPTPTGNFVLMELGGALTYGKLYNNGSNTAAYLIINRAAAQAATPAQAEAAFLDPLNWTWSDGSTGQPLTVTPILTNTLGSGGHNIRESWTVPTSDPRANHVILYTADYVVGGVRGLGCAADNAQCLVVISPRPVAIPPQSVSSLPKTGFAPNKITSLPAQPAELVYVEMSDLWLEIPSLKVQANIVGVPQSENTWDVKWLGQDAGWLNGTAFPTWEGNSVITAHVTNADGLPGPFANLKNLKYGEQIIFHLLDQQYVFEIRNKRLVRPETTAFAFEHLEDHSYLTLITCQGYDPATDSYRQRRLIRAVLMDIK